MSTDLPSSVATPLRDPDDTPATSAPGDLNRRNFLIEAAALAGGVVLGAAQAAVTTADMAKLSAFLTGKSDLSAELVRRAHQALLAADADFDRKLARLSQRIDAAGLQDVDAFKISALAKDAELMATAVAVIGAFYTGRVGGNYHGHLVSYEEALMYRPTADVTVIPTYARGVPGYWVEAPKT